MYSLLYFVLILLKLCRFLSASSIGFGLRLILLHPSLNGLLLFRLRASTSEGHAADYVLFYYRINVFVQYLNGEILGVLKRASCWCARLAWSFGASNWLVPSLIGYDAP